MNRAEEYRQQLVANEISFGFTLIESARLSHGMGHWEHRNSAHAKAEAACGGAQHFLAGQSGPGWDDLWSEWKRLRVALDTLPASLKDCSNE
jgi:hypothetical protein